MSLRGEQSYGSPRYHGTGDGWLGGMVIAYDELPAGVDTTRMLEEFQTTFA